LKKPTRISRAMPKPSTFLKVPTDRVGVLIGPDGRTKKVIEEKLSVILQVDSESGDVAINLTDKTDDPSLLFRAKDVITAIARGFSSEHAFRLIFDEDTMLDVIDLRSVFGKSESDIKRVKGRIIGMNGKTRKIIEELTDCNVAVYGHTVSIIGSVEGSQAAREAIQMLIGGSLHSVVYRALHRRRRELKKKKLELWKKPEEQIK
jgi:ribosomal RNA assembly protein